MAVAIAKALIVGGSQRQSVLKACAVAIANYGCSKIQPTLASLPQLPFSLYWARLLPLPLPVCRSFCDDL